MVEEFVERVLSNIQTVGIRGQLSAFKKHLTALDHAECTVQSKPVANFSSIPGISSVPLCP